MKTKIVINPPFSRIADFIAAVPDAFDNSGETIFHGRNTLKRIAAPDGSILVIKRFRHLPFLRRLIYSTVSRSKARRAFDNGMQFLSLGFDTPSPVAYIETRRRGILADAYFISLNSDSSPLFVPLVESDRYDAALADKVAALMAALHDKGAVHGDPNLNNILYSTAPDGSVALTLIDTNRSRFCRRLSSKTCFKNLMRVTHRRDLMRHIAGRYASLRGLDPVATVDRVFTMLQRFERNRALRHRLKSLLSDKKR